MDERPDLHDAGRLRPLFQLDPELIFLNHGSFGACPRPVMAAWRAWQDEMERNPVEFLGRRSGGLLREARARLGEFLGARGEDLAFMPNATTGVNTVAQSLPLQAGDEVLSTDLEYGACVNAWGQVMARSGARLVTVPVPLPFDAASFTERIWAGVTPKTRVLFLSHVCSETALILPIAELVQRARAAGIWTVIDGAHAPGLIPLDLDALGADFYTGNCHKWMCAPKGSAFLHVRSEVQSLVHALTISWGYSDQALDRPYAKGYLGETLLENRLQWQGTRDISAFLAVPAAIDFWRQHDGEAVRARCRARARALLDRWCRIVGLPPTGGPEYFAQMVPLPVPEHLPADELKRRLFDEHRIEVPVTCHVSPSGRHMAVRASIQGYNSEADEEALIEALQQLLALR